MTILEALNSISKYDISDSAIAEIAIIRGLTLTDEATQVILTSTAYSLAKGDVYEWLATNPDITEGGFSINLPASARNMLHEKAKAIYSASGKSTTFGYKGENF